MSDIPALLLASLSPQSRKQAEQSLQSYSLQPAFVTHLLQLVLDGVQDRAVRLAGSVYLKNVVKLRWMEADESPISEQDKISLKSQLVPAMIALSNPAEKAIRAQIAASVSLIAELDFPQAWPDLVDQLVASLSADDLNINLGVLETAHSIFAPWRSQSRSDDLFSTINLVLEKFSVPFLQLFQLTLQLLFSTPSPQKSTLETLSQTVYLLVELFHDLTCQDLAPRFEDGHKDFFDKDTGYFMRLMAWDPTELQTDSEDTAPSVPSKIRTSILEIAEMYVNLYPEVLSTTSSVEAFVRAIWEIVGGGKQLDASYDLLVSQSLRFISTAIRSGSYKDIFGSRETISGLVQGVVVPNVGLREHDLEIFEDSPLEFVRSDLALMEITTPRQAAGDVIKALGSSGFGTETTEVVGEWIQRGLQDYSARKGSDDAWKNKDSAIYLFENVAIRTTTTLGVTSTNALVDIVKFFSDNIFQDLQADPGSVHPVLQVDAIRYLYVFRNQLTKEQLTSVLPLLTRHLASDNMVVSTYASVAIDRILSIRSGTTAMFDALDVAEFAPQLIDMLLSKLETSTSPEKVAENDFLIRCVMRLILTARHTLVGGYESILQRLVAILGITSKNPSNPLFDQYLFESVSALIRFIGPAKADAISIFEQTLFGPFTVIIQQDIDQYIPYIFQILAQMLDQHSGVPTDYRSLLPFLLTPSTWQQKGNVPGLVKLLKAFLVRDSAQMVATGQFASVLAVVQQRLIPSRTNDAWGFELLQAVVRNVRPSDLEQYIRPILITLLTRLQTSKTDIYVYYFVYFLMYTMAIQVEGLTPNFIVLAVESIQPSLWSQLCINFVIPQAPKLQPKDRKVAIVGLTRMLTQSSITIQEPSVKLWPDSLGALARLFYQPDALKRDAAEDPHAGLTAIDLEEQSAGYQAAYARLAAAEAVPEDPVGYIGDLRQFVINELTQLARTNQGAKTMIQTQGSFVNDIAAVS